MMIYVICKDGMLNQYVPYENGPFKGCPKAFESKKSAQEWIDKHSYKGMSFKYEVVEV